MPEWNQSLGLVGNREGCTASPAECASNMEGIAAEEGGINEIYVSMPFNVSSAATWAAQYSELSLTDKVIVGIGFDDFVGTIEDLQIAGELPNPASFVSDVISATKSKNPNLKFGVTIYEDSLTHAVLTDAVIPASLRAQFDTIHLFVHYREDGPNYASYVAQAKAIFPNAKIIAGAYPYDRIDYLPCQYKGTVPCTAAQEQSYYKQLLQIQANLLKAGTVSGIEFFFGYFGNPQDWPSWTSQTRICNPSRLPTCYSNSAILQNISLEVLQSAFSSSPASISLPYSSVYMGELPLNTKCTYPFKLTVTNTGGSSATISSISVAGTNGANFSVSNGCPSTLNAGSSCTLSIYFEPTAAGTRAGELILTSSTGTQTVTLTGTGQ